MSKKSKKRLLTHWFVRKCDGYQLLGGFEIHAGRWIFDRIIYQTCSTHRGQPVYLFVCENYKYKVLEQAPWEMWRI